MLCVIFADTRVVFANDLIKSLINLGAARSVRVAWLLDLTRVRHLVGASTGYTIVVRVKPMPVDTEGSTFTIMLILSKVRLCLILNVVKAARIVQHMLHRVEICTLH